MALTLTQFETIDGHMGSLLRMGEFETCTDPIAYIRADNRLLDALYDALGMVFVDDFASALECAAHVVAGALLGTIEVVDAEAVS